jgi:hypothetical protein
LSRAGKKERMVTDLLLLERLSDRDLALLTEVAGGPGPGAASLREQPGRIDELLARPEVFRALFDEGRDELLLAAGPFLAFAVLLAHAPGMLEGLSFVAEPVGRRRRLPVFEVQPLRDFLADPLRRLFLADLLASYTHVASGPLWVRGRRGWRHRRFSELDPAQLAELILVTPLEQRLVLYRRLGDLALFLSGVFPDHVATRLPAPIAVERLARAVTQGEAAIGRRQEPLPLDLGGLDLYERLGSRAYGVAWEATEYRELGPARVLGDVAQHFRHARMILNLLTDRYLFEQRSRWFPMGA